MDCGIFQVGGGISALVILLFGRKEGGKLVFANHLDEGLNNFGVKLRP